MFVVVVVVVVEGSGGGGDVGVVVAPVVDVEAVSSYSVIQPRLVSWTTPERSTHG